MCMICYTEYVNLFNKDFFSLAFGFIGIVALSVIIILMVSAFGGEDGCLVNCGK